MGERRDSGRRWIGAAARAAFVAALRDGCGRNEAAEAAGFTLRAFYRVRDRDPVFALAWAWAVELSARRAVAGGDAETEIAPNNGRALQRRSVRRVRFDDRRKRIFLDHFAGTADAGEAAGVAGVGASTVFQHRRADPEFAAGWDEALAVAYAALEAEAVRQRLAAQRDLSKGLCPTGEISKEFERVMQLLARYDRRDGRIAARQVGRGGERRMSFDEAIVLLDKRLRALGARHGVTAEPTCLPSLDYQEEEV